MQTVQQILDIFDAAAESYTFPMLDNGYVYPADVRLTALRGAEDWCVVIETVCVFNRFPNPEESICCWLTYLGNCLKKPARSNFVSTEAWQAWLKSHPFDSSHIVCPVSHVNVPLVNDDEYWISPAAEAIRIRDQIVTIPRDAETYAGAGVVREDAQRLETHELLRALVATHQDALRATREEWWTQIDRPPESLQVLLQLEEWRHPDLAEDELPSQSQAFPMIAQALVSNDASCYSPTEPANTHWSNWPRGGVL